MFYTSSVAILFNESYLDDIKPELTYHDPGYEGALNIIGECEENFNMIMKAIGIDEIVHLESTGKILIYENERIKSVFGWFRQFFTKLYKKVKDLYYTFIALLDSWVRKDEAFVKKYRSYLLTIRNVSKFKFKGYDYSMSAISLGDADRSIDNYIHTTLGLKPPIGPYTDARKNKNNDNASLDWSSNKAKHIEKFRGILVKEPNKKLSHSEFGKELFKKLRKGKDSPTEQKNINVEEHLKNISGYKEDKKIAGDAFTKIKDGIDKAIKDINNAEKNILANKSVETDAIRANAVAMRYASSIIEAYKEKLKVLQLGNGAILSALKQRKRQSKSVCVRLINFSKSKKSNESATYEEGMGSNLASIVFK